MSVQKTATNVMFVPDRGRLRLDDRIMDFANILMSVQVMFFGAVARPRPGSSWVETLAIVDEFFRHPRAGLLHRRGVGGAGGEAAVAAAGEREG